jgi:DUF4097 and DUF4098 domain-containing protein YvlB
MSRSKTLAARLWFVPALMLLTVALPPAQAQRDSRSSDDAWLERCRDGSDRDDRRARYCDVREKTVDATRAIEVDGGQNGGVNVHGWNRDEVLVRARIQAWGDDERAARDLADAISIETRDGRIRADGPRSLRGRSWSVSFDVYVPQRTDLRLAAHNGGIAVEQVEGRIDLETTNGGVSLREVAGDVRGETTNGGVTVELDGSRWRGSGLDVRTTNGGVTMSIPRDYSARLETGTVNGGMQIDFPITVQGSIGRRISTQLGSGGPLVRVTTTNGGVRIRQTR